MGSSCVALKEPDKLINVQMSPHRCAVVQALDKFSVCYSGPQDNWVTVTRTDTAGGPRGASRRTPARPKRGGEGDGLSTPSFLRYVASSGVRFDPGPTRVERQRLRDEIPRLPRLGEKRKQ